MTQYQKLLQDPRWDAKRRSILARDEYTCCGCGRTDIPLDVHHHYYENNLLPWEYDDDDVLISLCRKCHKKEEFNKNFEQPSFHFLLRMGCTRDQHLRLISAISRATDREDLPAREILSRIILWVENIGQ